MKNTDRARRASFAIAAKLFSDAEPFWDFVRKSFDVQSRTDLSEQDWVLIEARLRAAERHRSCRDALLCEVERG